MTILLDHCVPRRYRRLIESWGYHAAFLTDYLPPDSLDVEVIHLAQELDAALLTVDLDFANILDYPPQRYQGIIVLRYQADTEADGDAVFKTMLADLYRKGLRQRLVIVSAAYYRVRE
jgi:predicted nuclease of predicted toxin-antitoxin system